MPYTPTTWTDGVTPGNAANFNKLENGLAAAAGVADTALTRTPPPPANPGDNGKWLQASSGAMVWTVLPAIPPSIVDAKGDLIAGTANDTVARVPVGSNGQILVADSTQAVGVRWATQFIGCKIFRTTAFTIPTGVVTPIDLASEEFDTHAFHDVGTPSRITIPAGLAGKYLITGGFRWADDPAGEARGCIIRLNAFGGISSTFVDPGPTTGRAAHAVAAFKTLAVGDYVDLCGFHDKGSNLDTGTQNDVFLGVQFLGA